MAKSKTRRRSKTGVRRAGQSSRRGVRTSARAERAVHRLSSGRRVWFLRLGLFLVAPLVFLALLEIGLTVAGFGRPATFFVAGDKDENLQTNHWYIWFWRKARTTSPHPCLIQATKPSDTIRVFVLGESAAMGTPNPAFSFGRILEIMLENRFPDQQVEVVNAAMRGINSHIVARIAGECARLQPDLFIVYMGNNEVVGKYGPTTFVGHHPYLIPALQSIKEMRFYQGLRTAIESITSPGESETQPQTMAFFRKSRVALDDPRREAVYSNYQRNLRQICDHGRAAGAGVVVATVPVNLAEFSPLAFLHRRDLKGDPLEQWQALYDSAVADEDRQQWADALAGYEKAAAIDDHYADLHFRLARCHLALGDAATARTHFSLARDWDALQFRTDSRLNAIIRDVVSTYGDSKIGLADLESAIATSPLCPDGIAGDRVFYDQVHYTFDGGYELARLLLPAVVQALEQDRGLVPTASTEIPSRDECATQLAFTAWDQVNDLTSVAKMLALPPFLDQLDHAQRQARVEETLAEARAHIDEAFIDNVMKSYDEAIRLSPDDWVIRYNYANFLYLLKRYAQAVPHIQYVVNLFGDIAAYRVLLGYSLAGSGYVDQGLEQLNKARELDRNSQTVRDALATVMKLKRDLAQRARN